ncbi:insulinase family protein [Cellvibrio sp. PSBB006]|uniref:insulinase family protein n=1 Tax=Cellvibrio sp. PSBB006 TaxID=1987723 RepID=UPI000B3B9262|nr:insulinase family protein [Cellvibrio sp. PSBB006]ARU26293.1 peptidase M16 [Cellvibrio sp. PSBB006]
MTSAHPSFELLRSQHVEALKIRVEEYRHKATGAQHIHLAADNNENVFLVALRTVPHDSTGVAHILEHTALCGSERYPVRDPFFMMIRRSLNTFMNAFTSSDWTAYPFASQNLKDFNNLLDVYLDAVFFSRLDELDFAQEGHRVEFAEADNPDSELVFKGVVYNEMKGAMSSVASQLWHTLCKYLYPSTTYHFNSGGDPEHIPDLTYEQLKHFYQTHYHPSNAIFMTYGDIPAATHQARFESQALSRFEQLDSLISVPAEKRYYAPVCVEEAYPLDESEDDDLSHKTHVVMAWLLGKTTNLAESLEAHLLSNVLLDNSASPLQQALETTELGQAPSPLCGMDDSQHEIAFVCGLEGCALEDVDKVEQLILDTLQQVAEEGVPQQLLEASLHQLELQQREVGGDGYPYGLQLIMTSLTAATHRGDPIALLDLDTALADLRAKIQQPDFIQQLARTLLLDNPHRVRLTLRPDTQMNQRVKQAEIDRLAELKSRLTETDKQAIIERSHALQARQLRKDDESLLPKVGLEDIPPQLHYIGGSHETFNGYPLRRYSAGTNGLVYQQITCKLPALDAELKPLLPLYCIAMTELGVGDKDYLATQRWQAEVVGSINAFSSVRGSGEDVQAIDAYLTLSAKALTRNNGAMSDLMHTTLTEVRFDELSRLRELVAQTRARREQSVTGNGHSLAMSAACAGMSPAAKLTHELSGLAGIQALKALDNGLDDEQQLQAYADKLSRIHQLVLAAPRQFLLVGEQEHLDDYLHDLQQRWPAHTAPADFQAFHLPPVNEQIQEAWLTNTQVNFCVKAYPTVPADHPDAAVLTVLGGFLRNGYLHRTIREQGGAYGGGANQDNHSAAFRFYSYRDPRLADTLKDFDAVLDWLQSTSHDWQSVEEAILGVIGSIDKPGSPAGEAKSTYHAELFGRTREKREQFRNRVLAVTLADLQRVATTYLRPERASVAVVSHNGQRETLDKLGLVLKTL